MQLRCGMNVFEINTKYFCQMEILLTKKLTCGALVNIFLDRRQSIFPTQDGSKIA